MLVAGWKEPVLLLPCHFESDPGSELTELVIDFCLLTVWSDIWTSLLET